jgi:hypothetical protein
VPEFVFIGLLVSSVLVISWLALAAAWRLSRGKS